MVAKVEEPRNGKTAYYPLWHGGGCYRLAQFCPDVLKDPKLAGSLLNNGVNSSGLGTDPQGADLDICRQITGRRYPTTDIAEDDPTVFRPAVHRAPAVLDINRTVSFKPVYDKRLRKAFANQDEILRMYREIRDCLEVPFAFGMVFVPMKTQMEAVHWCVRCPVEGLCFDILESYSGTVLASVDASVEDSGIIDTSALPFAYSHDKNRIVDVCITKMPDISDDKCKDGPSGLDGFEFSTSVKLCCLGLGQ